MIVAKPRPAPPKCVHCDHPRASHYDNPVGPKRCDVAGCTCVHYRAPARKPKARYW